MRSIPCAKNEKTGEILEAESFFPSYTAAFKQRKEYHLDKLSLTCIECGEKLRISSSKYDQMHFKHFSAETYCILKDEKISEEESEKIGRILISKESQRHKDLKNGIASRLKKMPGIDPSSVQTEYSITLHNKKHRPDVYCRYNNQEIVFEVQLSSLSPRYIFSRYDFYRSNGIYLIWILEEFDVHEGVKQFERDIKYLSEHQNFFKLNESVTDELSLTCDYKYCLLNDNSELRTPWKQKAVSLSNLTFDNSIYQAYYYNFESNKTQLENRRKEIIAEQEEKERVKASEARLLSLSKSNEQAVKIIRHFFKKKYLNIDDRKRLRELISSDDEIDLLNASLGFTGKNKDYISSILFDVTQLYFIQHLLDMHMIRIDLSVRSSENLSLLQHFITYIPHDNLFSLLTSLFEAGYLPQSEDWSFINEIKKTGDSSQLSEVYLCEFLSGLPRKSMCSDVHTISRYLFAIASLRDKKTIGFNYKGDNSLLQILHLLLTNPYLPYYNITTSALSQYNLHDYIVTYDKNKKLRGKLKELSDYFIAHERHQVEINSDYDEILFLIFPELF